MSSLDEVGVLIGHYTDRDGGTGCTVVICPRGAVAGVSVRGGAPCTRETDIFRPGTGVDPRLVHGVLLTGGSVFGLAAADGVVRFLGEKGIGLDTGQARIPIVGVAGLYDLALGRPDARPDAGAGYAACAAAGGGAPEEGSVGAGTGATVGKAAGMERCSKGGLGVSAVRSGSVLVQAIAAVNALGEVVDPADGRIVAGVRAARGTGFQATEELLSVGARLPAPLTNTALGVVVTNAPLNREEATEVACGAHDGFAQTIRPAHTRVDGDAIFVLGTGGGAGSGLPSLDVIALQYAAARAMAQAVLRAVRLATGLAGVPAAAETGKV